VLLSVWGYCWSHEGASLGVGEVLWASSETLVRIPIHGSRNRRLFSKRPSSSLRLFVGHRTSSVDFALLDIAGLASTTLKGGSIVV